MKKEKTKQEKKKLPGIGTTTVFAKNLYENNVGKRAVERAGKNKNLKGHVFEQLTVDKINRNPSNILKGKKAVLTKSPTAVRDDILIKQNGKVVKRMQLKDTPKGIRDTVDRVKNKQYAGTNLVGTKETVKAYRNEVAKKRSQGIKITQKITDNGITSEQTKVISAKVLGGSLAKQSRAIAGQAVKTGAKSAAFSVTVGTITNAKKVIQKEITVKKAVGNVAKDSARNAVSATVGDAVAAGVTIVVAGTPAAPVAGVAGTVAGVGVSMVVDNVMQNKMRK